MEPAPSLHQRLYGDQDWCTLLRTDAAAVRARGKEAGNAAPALELAGLLERIEPDRTGAVEMYLVGWKAGRDPSALARARALCLELGDLAAAAKIARLEHQHRPDPSLLYEEGVALLDADDPDGAILPLTAAARARPDDPAIAAALATARREWVDPVAEVERLVSAARALPPGDEAGRVFLQAARVVRLQRGDRATYGRMLEAAVEAAPRAATAYALLEAYLLEHGDGDRLLALYRRRLAAAASHAERFDDLRRAGVRLVLGGVQPGLGYRLLDRALHDAYGDQLTELPGELACLELLRRHAIAASALPRFVALLGTALTRAHDALAIVWLAAVGLEVAWRLQGDRDGGRGFAARLAAIAPQHPTLLAFLAAGGVADDGGPPDGGDSAGPPASTEPPLDLDLEIMPEPPVAEPTPPPVDLAPAEPIDAAPAPSATRPAVRATTEGGRALGRVALVSRPAHLVKSGTARGRSPRLEVPIDLILTPLGDATFAPVRAITRDLSGTGMFVVTSAALDSAEPIGVELRLPRGRRLEETTFTARARIVRTVAGRGFGLAFVDPASELLEAIDAMATQEE